MRSAPVRRALGVPAARGAASGLQLAGGARGLQSLWFLESSAASLPDKLCPGTSAEQGNCSPGRLGSARRRQARLPVPCCNWRLLFSLSPEAVPPAKGRLQDLCESESSCCIGFVRILVQGFLTLGPCLASDLGRKEGTDRPEPLKTAHAWLDRVPVRCPQVLEGSLCLRAPFKKLEQLQRAQAFAGWPL